MAWTKKQFEDFSATLDFWDYARETGCRGKYTFDGIERINNLLNGCAFCEYFMSYDIIGKATCIQCYLHMNYICNHNGPKDLPYFKWTEATSPRWRKYYAGKIYSAIREWMISEGMIEEEK